MSRADPRPIALTCGEPAGIGAEIAVLARLALPDLPFFWLGDPGHLPQGAEFAEIATPDQVALVPKGVLPVLAYSFAGQAIAGRPDPANAQGVIDVIARAVALVQDGQARALCTLPIHKKALQEGAGFAFPGHTEYLAHLAGGASVVMMLASAMPSARSAAAAAMVGAKCSRARLAMVRRCISSGNGSSRPVRNPASTCASGA